ncbi:MAG: response regulator [Desulfarculaceae bacterium]|nr:response regulator [Desulfarculaceae bacterium]MCF8071795.1 response regulator [Desulfarculaceae bacterium]MCF8101345.1 response regulator [Desulfarculaceae bacterium]MCF8117194.1 response regulator [Desulfarculaceae bacterium]
MTPPLVLIVEDDTDTAALYSAVLESEGMEVVHCMDRQQANRWWGDAERRPDLVVLDVRLPDGSGLDLCSDFGGSQPGQLLPPIIVLSAHGDPRMPSLCRQAGAAAFLDKLETLDNLVDKAKELLEKQRLTSQA